MIIWFESWVDRLLIDQSIDPEVALEMHPAIIGSLLNIHNNNNKNNNNNNNNNIDSFPSHYLTAQLCFHIYVSHALKAEPDIRK